jgi:hypothetical protein
LAFEGNCDWFFCIGLRAVLSQYGAVPAEKIPEEDDRSKELKKTIYQSRATAALSDDDESDTDDRGYY